MSLLHLCIHPGTLPGVQVLRAERRAHHKTQMWLTCLLNSIELISQRKEVFVEACIVREFRVEGCREQMSLLRRDNPSIGDRG